MLHSELIHACHLNPVLVRILAAPLGQGEQQKVGLSSCVPAAHMGNLDETLGFSLASTYHCDCLESEPAGKRLIFFSLESYNEIHFW